MKPLTYFKGVQVYSAGRYYLLDPSLVIGIQIEDSQKIFKDNFGMLGISNR